VLIVAFMNEGWSDWFSSRLTAALLEHTFVGSALPRVEVIVTTPIAEAAAAGTLVFYLIGEALTNV
jgi:hypothetical protein